MKQLFFATLIVFFCGTYGVAEPTNPSGGLGSVVNPGTGTLGKTGEQIGNTNESRDAVKARAKNRNKKGSDPQKTEPVPDTQAGGSL